MLERQQEQKLRESARIVRDVPINRSTFQFVSQFVSWIAFPTSNVVGRKTLRDVFAVDRKIDNFIVEKEKKKKTAKYRWERNIARINGKVGSSRSSGVKRILLKSFELMDAANRWRGLIEPCTPNRVFPRISISSRVFTLITNSGAYARATSRWARKQENFHQPLSDRIIFA